MSKISVVAKLPVKDGCKEEFIDAASAMMQAVQDEPGTEVYVLNWDNKDENVAYMYEVYTDKAALDAHSNSDAMATFMTSLANLLGGAPDLTIATPASAKGIEL